MKLFFYISLLSVLFFSCTKFGKNITVTGRVLNPITGEGFEGIEVQLQKIGKGLPAGYETVKETTTDADGYFEINHLGGASGYLIMAQTTAEIYRLGWFVDGQYKKNDQFSVPKGKKMNVDYHALSYGKLKTTLNNISCENAGDVITLTAVYRIKPDAGIFGTGTYNGCYNNTTTSSDIPMGYYDFTWTVTKTSTGTNTFTGQVFVPAGGVGEITINY